MRTFAIRIALIKMSDGLGALDRGGDLRTRESSCFFSFPESSLAAPKHPQFLKALRETFLGEPRQRWQSMPDLSAREWLAVGPLLVLTVATNGARIARVFVVCGIIYFWATLAARVRSEARRALTRLTRVLDRNAPLRPRR